MVYGGTTGKVNKFDQVKETQMPQPAKKTQSKGRNAQAMPTGAQEDTKMRVLKGGINSAKNLPKKGEGRRPDNDSSPTKGTKH